MEHREILILTDDEENKLNVFGLLDTVLGPILTHRFTKHQHKLSTTFFTIRFFTLEEITEEKLCGIQIDEVIELNCKMPDELWEKVRVCIRL